MKQLLFASLSHELLTDLLELLVILAECLPAVLVRNHTVYLTIIHIERLVKPLTVHLHGELRELQLEAIQSRKRQTGM